MLMILENARDLEPVLAAISGVENVAVEYCKPLNAKGTRYRLKLTVQSSRGQYGKRSNSHHAGGQGFRRVHALCWHGFRDAFRAAFRVAPNTRFHTGLAKWNGSEDFEARFEDSGFTNIGSAFYPLYARQACACHRDGAFQD